MDAVFHDVFVYQSVDLMGPLSTFFANDPKGSDIIHPYNELESRFRPHGNHIGSGTASGTFTANSVLRA